MEQEEFRIVEVDEQLGVFSTLTPLYAAFHEDDPTFSLMWTAYREDFAAFHQAYLEDQRRYGGNHGILAKKTLPPPNAYTVSCIPWVGFTYFAVHSYQNKPSQKGWNAIAMLQRRFYAVCSVFCVVWPDDEG